MSSTPSSDSNADPSPTGKGLVRQARAAAVIDIGTTSIRMAIAEIDNLGGVRKLESLSQAVSLGKDTFTQGAITKATIEDCVRVLRSYRRILEEYRVVSSDQIRVVATSAVREARNRLAFLDRVHIATGMDVQPLDEAEVNRITYLGIQPFLQSEPSLVASRVMVVEVGGGSTEMLLVRDAHVTFAHTYRLGSLRLRKMLENFRTPQRKVREIMETHVRRTVEQVREQLAPLAQGLDIELIALGGDMRFAAARILPEWTPGTLARVPVPLLERFTDGILRLSDDDIVRQYHTTFPEAETAGPALLAYVLLAQVFERPHVLVTNTNLRDGLLKEMAVGHRWNREFSNQIIRSALDLGRVFNCDEAHARHVAEMAKSLFHDLRGEHKLEPRHEVILYVAALLHEIGLFINVRSHHKHAMYIIKNSELFGLSRKDLLLVALTARYHRRASPQPLHEGYALLDREDRVAVAKMAAMLRVAVALDESRSQRVKGFRCHAENGSLVLHVPGVEDLSLEQLAIRQSGTLFEEVFGMPAQLRAVRDTPKG
ncbi:MAG: HD domain-containing protein [Planctomycetes bacterium]|nr:HD domain-containing protein [Planctomycetota bacterium]